MLRWAAKFTGRESRILAPTRQRTARLKGFATPNVEKSRILVIGDALRTDIKGAENYGCDALFIASGIHRHETVDGLDLSATKLSDLFGPNAPPAIGAMLELAW